MDDDTVTDPTASDSGSPFWRAARFGGLLAALAFLTYFKGHDPFASLPDWVTTGIFGMLFVVLGVVDLRTKTAPTLRASVSQEQQPESYWFSTGLHLTIGVVGLVAATGAAMGLWPLR